MHSPLFRPDKLGPPAPGPQPPGALLALVPREGRPKLSHLPRISQEDPEARPPATPPLLQLHVTTPAEPTLPRAPSGGVSLGTQSPTPSLQLGN